MSARISKAERLLITCVTDDTHRLVNAQIAALYHELGDEEVFVAATENKVIPLVAHALLESLTSESLPQRWSVAHNETFHKTNAFLGEVERVSEVLSRSGIRCALIENGGVLGSVRTCPGCFVSNDLEILVNRTEVAAIDQLLRQCGYGRGSRNRTMSEDLTRPDQMTRGWENYHCQTADGVTFWLNVQWRPVLRRWIPMGSELSTSELLGRSVLASPAGKTRVLGPEDNLLVCALHTGSHTYVRGPGLRLQLDVDRLVRRTCINWSIVVERAKNNGVGRIVFAALDLAARLLETPVPPSVLEDLCPSSRARKQIRSLLSLNRVFASCQPKFGIIELLTLEASLAEAGMALGMVRRVLFPPGDWMIEGVPEATLGLGRLYARRLLDLAARKPF